MRRLDNFPFRDRLKAQREITVISSRLTGVPLDNLSSLLSVSPSPEQCLHYLALLRERHPADFDYLTGTLAGTRFSLAVFGYSQFLANEVVEHPGWLAAVLEASDLHRVAGGDEFKARLKASLSPGIPPPLEFARFRRREILRILVRDVLRLGTLPEITAELTSLAGAIVETAYERIEAGLIEHYGTPRSPAGDAHFAVLALGKMGGEELNYSSDIDLMFLYSENGETSGTRTITNKEFFQRAANQLTALLSTYTAEGMCYRVDLRLRPDGSLGEVSIPLEGAKRYYAERARDWELQMMIKARVAAGHRPTGRALLEFVEPRIYKTTLDFSAVEELSATRERLNESLAARQKKRHRAEKTVDVKLDRGGIRDIEFLVQCLQRLYGGAEPWVRHGGTMLALARLQDKGFLSGAEYGKLASAYQFLRQVEHRLQFDEDLQVHTLPGDPEELEALARRIPGDHSAETLMNEWRSHCEQVIEIYERVVHSSGPLTPPGARYAANVVRALDYTAPVLREAMSEGVLHRGYRTFEHF
ncbi:MAG TPA: hypothetical protein VFV14_05490, partial [Myxococcaceae bacterium]|nr:hypothetical protein [Myxococcaceae bacterium]